MRIHTADYSPNAVYHLLTQSVLPRPIAWVLSDNGEGEEGRARYNLAPFSFFNAFSANPPLLGIGINRKATGDQKDTWSNIDYRKKCVVHLATAEMQDKVVDSSVELPEGMSELLRQNYELIEEFEGFPPRIKDAPIAFFCEKELIHTPEEAHTAIVLLRIKHIFISDDVKEEQNGRLYIDPLKVQPLARLGGRNYTIVKDTFELSRPEK